MKRAPLLLAALLFALAAVLTGWLIWPGGDDAWQRAQREGTIRVGYSLEAPYAFRDAGGRVTGEAPEVAREILARLGIRRIEWVQTEFGTLIPKLRAGRFDIIAAGMFRTREREREIAFSRPTYCAGSGFLVRAGNPSAVGGYADLARRADGRLAVLAGAVEAELARQAGVPEARIIGFPDAESAVEGVRTGMAEALALTAPSVRALAGAHAGVEAVVPEEAPEGRSRFCGAFGFRQQDRALREAFDRELARYLGTAAHLERVRPLGFGREDLPPETPSSPPGAGAMTAGRVP